MVTGNYFNDMEKGKTYLDFLCCLLLLFFFKYRCHCHLESLDVCVTLLLESILQKISLKLFYMEVKVLNLDVRQAQQHTDLVNIFYI